MQTVHFNENTIGGGPVWNSDNSLLNICIVSVMRQTHCLELRALYSQGHPSCSVLSPTPPTVLYACVHWHQLVVRFFP